jgi:hypothetical protein
MWDGEPAVTINGTAYTGQTLGNARLTFGTPDLLAGVQPPYGSISLINTTGSPLPIYLADSVVVDVWNSGKTSRRLLFTGVISDISVSLLADDVAIYDLTVVGNSQFFESRIIGQIGFPLQPDEERFRELIQAGTGQPIDLLSGTINAQSVTIDGFPNYLGTATPSPSSFDLVVPTVGEAVNAGEAIAEFATATSGWVWEGANGLINFRPFDAPSTTTVTVAPAIVYVGGLRRTSTLTELYNDITILPNEIESDFLGGTSTNKQDLVSQAAYGTRNLSLVTQYRHGPGAPYRWEEQADYLLDTFANNIQQLDGITIDLTSDTLVPTTRNPLINLDMTQTINFDLPDDIFDGGTGSGIVSGWSWSISDKILDLTINLVKVA